MSGELTFSGLSLVKGGGEILRGVAGRFRSGEITAILGPNGAGKSSLLHCLAGLEPNAGGAVTVDGSPLASLKLRERARHVGFLPQQAEVHWNLSVHALVALGRLAHSGGGALTSADEAILDRVMAYMDITHLAGRPVLSLSGGERARVLLARVLAGEPRWLLADEPLASLDPAHQLAVLRHLRQAAQRGAGVAVVVHDVNHAARIADHVVLMMDGTIIADGNPEVVLTPEWLERAFGVPFRQVVGVPPLLIPGPHGPL